VFFERAWRCVIALRVTVPETRVVVPSPAPRLRPVTGLTNFHVLYVPSLSQPKCSAPIACLRPVALPPNIPSAATTELKQPPLTTLPRKSPECCVATATRHGRSIESDGPAGLQELGRDPTIPPPPSVCQLQVCPMPFQEARGEQELIFSIATTTARAPAKLRGGLYRRTITTIRSPVPESALADACHG
jgi:hypothetical protein